jgi:hypothetical protein
MWSWAVRELGAKLLWYSAVHDRLDELCPGCDVAVYSAGGNTPQIQLCWTEPDYDGPSEQTCEINYCPWCGEEITLKEVERVRKVKKVKQVTELRTITEYEEIPE